MLKIPPTKQQERKNDHWEKDVLFPRMQKLLFYIVFLFYSKFHLRANTGVEGLVGNIVLTIKCIVGFLPLAKLEAALNGVNYQRILTKLLHH